MPVVMDADRIERSLTRIAHEIVERNRAIENLALVGIRERGVHLAQRLGDPQVRALGAREIAVALARAADSQHRLVVIAAHTQRLQLAREGDHAGGVGTFGHEVTHEHHTVCGPHADLPNEGFELVEATMDVTDEHVANCGRGHSS